MVITRGMLNCTVNLIEDTFASTDGFDVETETVITNLCLDLKKLEANHPDIILTDVQLNITKLLQRLDEVMTSNNNSGTVIKDLQCNILTLESRLEREKQQRQCDLNASFSELDAVREEKDIAMKEKSIMTTSLVNVKSKLESLSNECSSLQSAIHDKDKIIASIRLELEASNKQRIELTDLVTNLKSSVKKAEENSWLKSRWVDDTLLDSHFQAFNSNSEDKSSKVIFMGPSLTQLVKHATFNDVKKLLGDLRFSEKHYAFLCISDNPVTFKQDNGSHWSLMFVDIASKLVYHFDSHQGTNLSSAKTVATKLGFNMNVRGNVSNRVDSSKCLNKTENKAQTRSMSSVLLIGDSLLRFSGKRCAEEGAIVDVNPGSRISHIKGKLEKYKSAQPEIIYLLVGTNNLGRGYNGGPGYDGGWGKREALHSMADLLSTAKRTFPNSVIIVNSVLTRKDISQRALFYYNDQLMLMCNNFNVEFFDVTEVIRPYHLARDGTHLNRRGNECFGNLIFLSLRTIHEAMSNVSSVCPNFQVSAETNDVCPSIQSPSESNLCLGLQSSADVSVALSSPRSSHEQNKVLPSASHLAQLNDSILCSSNIDQSGNDTDVLSAVVR
ncbi:hypothetical protein J6590_104278 [Homalodisca vitripennis]|nr:hypothetical protein J6590_104278 [Homalodisca vitripennis]